MNRELTSAEAWMLDLDLASLTDREVAEVRRYFELMPPPPNFGKIRAAIDGKNGFSWWAEAFQALAPPSEQQEPRKGA
jgi:hypothetical protein